MGLKDLLIKRIVESNEVKKIIDKRIQEQTPPATGVDADDWKYRPLTVGKKDRKLSPLKQQRMQEIAFWLWDSTPLGHRIIEMTKDFTVGEGIKYEVEDADVKEVIDKFWFDRDNAWDTKQTQRVRELGLFGEQFYPVFVNNANGKVIMSYIDPTMVSEVIADERNPERLITVKVGKVVTDTDNKSEFKIIDIDRDVNSKTYGKLVGEIFYFPVNKVSSSTRGRSDLLSVADWIDIHEKYLFNVSEKAYIQTMFVWDFLFEGRDQKWIDEWIQTHAIDLAKPGSNFYHNEKIELSAKNPKLEARDSADEARLVKNHILSGVAIPEHWVGEGDKTTRATALEMGEPSFKHFRGRQLVINNMIRHIFDFVIDQAIIHQRLDAKVNRKFTIILPPITRKDLSEISKSLVAVTTSLATATEEGWITDDDAKRVYKSVISKIGVEISEPAKAKVKEDLTEEKQRELARKLQEAKK